MNANLGRLLCRLSGGPSITTRPLLLYPSSVRWSPCPVLIQGAIRNYAARKGTRARKEKVKLANIAAKRGKVAEAALQKKIMMNKMKNIQAKPLFPDDSSKEPCSDNVFISGSNPWPIYSVLTAINNFKETHHPTMYDNPTASISAYLELNLTTKKKTQFLENVSGVVELPFIFETGKPIKTICVFCKDHALNEAVLAAGANVAVGLEGIKMFQNGDLNSEDYDVILSHPDVLPELAPIRGLLPKTFPNIKKGTVAFDLVALVKKYKSGIDYKMTPSVVNPKLGFMHVPLGNVSMPSEQMEKNFAAVIEAVLSHKPLGVPNSFLNACGLTSAFSHERFKVNTEKYENDYESNSDDVQTPKKEAASA